MFRINSAKIRKNLILNYRQPVNIIYIYWFKFIVGVLYLWKLLSRDFANISLWPASVISGYPVDIYPPDYILTTAIPPLFDLVTLHFIHWIVPFPGENILNIIQFSAIIFSISIILSPAKYSRFIGFFLYLTVAYLWGFVFRLGQDIDAVFLLQSSLLVFILLPYKNSQEYFQQLRFLVLIVFVIYYFFSGVNKIIDLSYVEWLKYDLININYSQHLAYLREDYVYVPAFPIQNDLLQNVMNNIGALVTYTVHIFAPLLLFSHSTKKFLFYWLFYSIFHFMTIYVGILFSMNFFAWLLILPVYKWFYYEKKS